MRARPEPLRIAAMSIAIASHVVIGLLLFLPATPLYPLQADDALVVTMVRVPRPAPLPPVPRRPERDPVSKPRHHPESVRPVPDDPGAATSDTTGAGDTSTWTYDPDAGITVVVYGDRSAIDVSAPEQAPMEIAGYRAGFDPSTIDGLNGPAVGGSATFDVLVDETGAPTALVIVKQGCGERALETAMSVISQWRFVPATRAGAPVAGWIQVALEF